MVRFLFILGRVYFAFRSPFVRSLKLLCCWSLFFLGFFNFFVYRYTYFLFHFFTWFNADLSKVLLKEKLRIRGGETAEFCSKIPKASPSHSACRMSGFAVRFLLYTMLFPLFFPVEAICRLFLSEGHFYWRSFALS